MNSPSFRFTTVLLLTLFAFLSIDAQDIIEPTENSNSYGDYVEAAVFKHHSSDIGLRIEAGHKLLVKLLDGRKVKGKFVSYSDNRIVLNQDGINTEVNTNLIDFVRIKRQDGAAAFGAIFLVAGGGTLALGGISLIAGLVALAAGELGAIILVAVPFLAAGGLVLGLIGKHLYFKKMRFSEGWDIVSID